MQHFTSTTMQILSVKWYKQKSVMSSKTDSNVDFCLHHTYQLVLQGIFDPIYYIMFHLQLTDWLHIIAIRTDSTKAHGVSMLMLSVIF